MQRYFKSEIWQILCLELFKIPKTCLPYNIIYTCKFTKWGWLFIEMSPLKISTLWRKTPLGRVNLCGERELWERCSLSSLVWLVAESEVLALSYIKDGSTVRTWIGRVPRYPLHLWLGHCSNINCSSHTLPSLKETALGVGRGYIKN